MELNNVILGVFTNRTDYISKLLFSVKEFLPNIPIVIQIADQSVGKNMEKLRQHFYATSYRFCVFLDDDIEFLDSHILLNTMQYMLKNDIAISGVYQTFDAETATLYQNNNKFSKLIFKLKNWVPGYFMMIDSFKMKNINFDVNIPGNVGYDVDYCFNAKMKGLNIALTPSVIKHVKDKYVNGTPFDADICNKYLVNKWGSTLFGDNFILDEVI